MLQPSGDLSLVVAVTVVLNPYRFSVMALAATGPNGKPMGKPRIANTISIGDLFIVIMILNRCEAVIAIAVALTSFDYLELAVRELFKLPL